jgi:anti-sigma B factor antagonist
MSSVPGNSSGFLAIWVVCIDYLWSVKANVDGPRMPKVVSLSMPKDSLRIDDRPGTQPGQRVLSLTGALVLTTVFDFQATVRADQSRSLIIDFANVAYVDSAGIGALVGAYVTRHNSNRGLALVGVSDRIHNALKITQVESFFRFYDSVSAAEEATAA